MSSGLNNLFCLATPQLTQSVQHAIEIFEKLSKPYHYPCPPANDCIVVYTDLFRHPPNSSLFSPSFKGRLRHTSDLTTLEYWLLGNYKVMMGIGISAVARSRSSSSSSSSSSLLCHYFVAKQRHTSFATPPKYVERWNDCDSHNF